MEEMRIIALDLGTKRVGLAVSDPLGLTAQGLDSLLPESQEDLINSIRKLISNYNIKVLIVGLPLNLNGTAGPKAREAIALAADLREKLNVPVETWDERLTSMEAERIMIEADTRRRQRKVLRDKLSAQIILQSYLDAHSRKD